MIMYMYITCFISLYGAECVDECIEQISKGCIYLSTEGIICILKV